MIGRYTDYRYLYPPRPETAGAPSTLPQYEKLGWWAQAKMNGTCTTLYVPPKGDSFAMGRAGPTNRLVWQPGIRWRAFRETLPGNGWHVFAGELLESKGVGVRDTMYLFDILVHDGEYLLGSSYRQRFDLLRQLCQEPAGTDMTHYVVAPGVWIARNHVRGFNDFFASINSGTWRPVEGLVFKNPDAKLAPCATASGNAKWQHKCRRATDHLSF